MASCSVVPESTPRTHQRVPRRRHSVPGPAAVRVGAMLTCGYLVNPSRTAVGPASRLRRRYADAPAAAPFRSRDGLSAALDTFLLSGACGPLAVKAKPVGQKTRAV